MAIKAKCRRGMANATMVDTNMATMTAADQVTVAEGYDAMRVFLETVWRRQGKTIQEIGFTLGALRWADGSPVDPTMWEDWLAAVQIARTARARQGEAS